MLHPHDGPILCPGGDFQLCRTGLPVDDQAVVACSLEGVWQALSQCHSLRAGLGHGSHRSKQKAQHRREGRISSQT